MQGGSGDPTSSGIAHADERVGESESPQIEVRMPEQPAVACSPDKGAESTARVGLTQTRSQPLATQGTETERRKFEERSWHWWLSRVVIPVTVASIALGGLLYVNRDKFGSAPAHVSDKPPPSSSTTTSDQYAGWGPLRDMYTIREVSPTAVFNSLIDDPVNGDQRKFVRCRIGADANYGHDVLLSDNKTSVAVYILIDDSSTGADQAIQGARMKLEFANQNSGVAVVRVTLSADNAATVWDGCNVLGQGHVSVSYVPGSAVLHPNRLAPIPLRDAVIRGEIPLPGTHGQPDGVVGGNADYWGYIELSVDAFVAG